MIILQDYNVDMVRDAKIGGESLRQFRHLNRSHKHTCTFLICVRKCIKEEKQLYRSTVEYPTKHQCYKTKQKKRWLDAYRADLNKPDQAACRAQSSSYNINQTRANYYKL